MAFYNYLFSFRIIIDLEILQNNIQFKTIGVSMMSEIPSVYCRGRVLASNVRTCFLLIIYQREFSKREFLSIFICPYFNAFYEPFMMLLYFLFLYYIIFFKTFFALMIYAKI